MIYLHINWQEYKGYYSGICKEIPRFIVSHTGNYDDFVKYIEESIDFYYQGCKDKDFLDGGYKIKFKQMIE